MIQETLTGAVILGVVIFLMVFAPKLLLYMGIVFGFWIVSYALGTLIREIRRDQRLDNIGKVKK